MPESYPENLTTPVLLMATPQVQDPFFERAVVLLLHHDEDGSFGFNLNRPTTVSISEILTDLEIDWQGDPTTCAYLGGPVQPQLGTVLFGEPGTPIIVSDKHSETMPQILPGLRMTQHIGDLQRLAKDPPSGFRMYLGYAGWAAGQLMTEIMRNDWIVGPVLDELLFTEDPDTSWGKALVGAGVDPDALPSWTPDDVEAGIN